MTETFSPALDAGAFAEQLLGASLWPHQLEVVRSPARYCVICAGRQVGKSRLLAVIALHTASTKRNALVLIVSAGETAARRLLDECAALAEASPLLRGSVLDDDKTLLTLSNGSAIRAVPASQRQIRGWPVDLLIVDEAGFIDPEIWRSAEPSIIARPGSRVILSSTPWGGLDHFFRHLWQRGMSTPDVHVASWHWPSSVSPLVDQALLRQIRERETRDYFAREYLAEWTDETGAYFTEDEIMSATADYEMCPPEAIAGCGDAYAAAAGVDWGMQRDANVLALVSVLDDGGLNRERFGDGLALFVPWFEAHHRMPYSDFIDRITRVAGCYRLPIVVSETNGVGQFPTEELQRRMMSRGLYAPVSPVVTDVRRKQSGFGMIKGLMQAGRLVLPREPELLKQLRALQFEQMPGGSLRIAVPDRLGHDDIAMALMQAVSACQVAGARAVSWQPPTSGVEIVATSAGVRLPREARPVPFHRGAFAYPRGAEHGEGW